MTVEKKPFKPKLKKGDPMVWLSAACTALVLMLFAGLIGIVAWFGLRTYWVPSFEMFRFEGGLRVVGAVIREDGPRLQIFTGNRDLYDLDFRWIDRDDLVRRETPEDLVLFERTKDGPFIGALADLQLEGAQTDFATKDAYGRLKSELKRMHQDRALKRRLEHRLADIEYRLTKLGRKLAAATDRRNKERLERQIQKLALEQKALGGQRVYLDAFLTRQNVLVEDASGNRLEIPLVEIHRIIRPNRMGFFAKLRHYLVKVGELFTHMPRVANTEGGVFPAIVGTVLMVLLMSVFCVPPGVIAAVYLNEYARDGMIVKLVRIAVNNLAGVPSIVYGIFGLGFFVYVIGGSIDRMFYAGETTFGTGGLLWCSLTLALLTVPVVIVSTEEGLRSVPHEIREGSVALGATRFQTLYRVVLPMATPGILTGLILAIARAAGEVAPLMLVGVAKVTASLPIDSQAPYFHPERKIMHLGYHIYDLGFQSPNVEAAKPMIYVTTLLLLVLVLGMSFIAMYLRNKVKKRYARPTF
ncbi:MAG: phosphate ABC transporter permease PstA [Acidobacteriota bacterium]|nr:phosphate ABC transporter permease PstA [Acidobacteriota bacterium]